MKSLIAARAWFELGLDFCAFLFLPILTLASKGAAPLAIAAGLCGLGLAAPKGRAAWRRVRGFALIFAALLVWGVLSSLWAVNPSRSLVMALRLAGMFVAGLALTAAAPEIASARRLIAWLCAGVALALALTLVQYASNGLLSAPFATRGFIEPALNHVEDGFGFVLLPLVVALLRQRRSVVAGVLAAVTVAVIFVLVGDAARIAFVVGVAAAAPIYFWRRGVVRLAAIGSVLVILAAPLIFPPLAGLDAARQRAEAVKFSLWHRLEIWSFVGGRIAERPLLGWGLDSSRAIPGGSAETPEHRQWLPLHPHNAPLQLWLELGVPGALLFALFAARLWLALGAMPWPRLYAAAAGGSLVTALVVALGSYGIWQEWMIGSEFLTLFLILAMDRPGLSSAAAHPPDRCRSRAGGV